MVVQFPFGVSPHACDTRTASRLPQRSPRARTRTGDSTASRPCLKPKARAIHLAQHLCLIGTDEYFAVPHAHVAGDIARRCSLQHAPACANSSISLQAPRPFWRSKCLPAAFAAARRARMGGDLVQGSGAGRAGVRAPCYYAPTLLHQVNRGGSHIRLASSARCSTPKLCPILVAFQSCENWSPRTLLPEGRKPCPLRKALPGPSGGPQ